MSYNDPTSTFLVGLPFGFIWRRARALVGRDHADADDYDAQGDAGDADDDDTDDENYEGDACYWKLRNNYYFEEL